MATEYELSITDYLSIMRRRAPYLGGVFIAVLLIAIVVAANMPPIYRATGTIMVESPQVADNLMPGAIKNQIDDRINVIKQRTLTRDSLLQIANKYNLFKESKSPLNTSELIDKMRERVGVELINTDTGQEYRSGNSTIAFTLSFKDQSPQVAYQVTKDLISLFLNLNVKLRTEGAAETTVFLTHESDKLKNELDRLEGMIAAFKRQNSDNLPEQLDLRANMLARAENDLHEVERDIRSTNEARHSLEVELSAVKSGMGEDPSQTLPRLKAEYAKLSAIYTESHPDIKALKRKINFLEQAPSTPEPKAAPASASGLAVSMIQARVDAANARLDSLTHQKKMLQDRIARNERAMVQTPRVKQELEVLVRDRDSAQKKYEELLSKKVNAEIAQNLESENKSERFSLLEPPLLPEKPFKTDRVKILLLGFFLAIVSSGGTIGLFEIIDKRIHGTEAFTHVLGYRPLIEIPYIPVQAEEALKKRMLMLTISASVVALITTAVVLHFLHMPLDTMFVKILAR